MNKYMFMSETQQIKDHIQNIRFVYSQSESMEARLLKMEMRSSGQKNSIKEAMETQTFQTEPEPMPDSLLRNCVISTNTHIGRNIWHISPREQSTGKMIFYMHGGSYINNLTEAQWKLIEQLTLQTQATLIVPNYPLAPAFTYKDVYAFIDPLYDELVDKFGSSNLILAGDSAGAGFLFAFAQKLRNENKPQPSQLILFSPWLDVTMSNPAMLQVDKDDPVLNIEGLKLAGKAYAGETETTNYLVSPLYGTYKELAPISIFIGTHDLFITDCRKLLDRFTEQKIPLNFFEYPRMFHVWVSYTELRETKDAIERVVMLSRD